MSLALPALRRSEVTTKRGLASPLVHSALATTRRLRLQLARVVHMKLLKRRAGSPVRRLFASACASSPSIMAISRSFFCRPNTKSTPFASHQVINSSRAKPESARNKMQVRGQHARMRDDARHLLHGAGRRVHIGTAQLGEQQMLA